MLSGIFLLISISENIPMSPSAKKYLHCEVSPTIIFRTAANDPPRCQVPSIPILTLPLYFGGRNSSIAEKIAVN